MFNLQSVLLISHVTISVAIIALVLLQRGKGADAGAAFGSGASGTVFGAKGSANFLSRTTAGLATLFFITSLSLAYLGSRSQEAQRSLMDDVAMPAEEISTVLPVSDDVPGAANELPGLPALEIPVTSELPQAGNETEFEEESSP
jgi:preprotein translocase subunit SecG